MSCRASSWRRYPKRSIASHRFCGSGRLFPLLEDETQRARNMTELSVKDDKRERGQAYSTRNHMSRNFLLSRFVGQFAQEGVARAVVAAGGFSP